MPGLDMERGLDMFEGDMEDYKSALSSFTKNAPDIIGKLRNVTEENLPGYTINIHGLKSISGWISAEDIRKGAEELEAMAKAGDFSGVIARNDTFLNDSDAFIQDLRVLLEKNSGE
jgi:HPt (histidine-containing phosphotransfer) domain-containing protein